MTDSLRTRIAKILYSQNADEDWNGKTVTWEEASKAYRECWLHDADVLIRELGLQRLEAGKWADGLSGHRYVTDWIANE